MGGPGCERPSKEHTARPWIALKTTNVYPQLWPRFTFFDSRLIHFRFVPPPTSSIEVHSPPSSLFRISTRIEIERRGWNVLLSRSIDSRLFEASNFQENLRGAEIKRAWKAWSLTVRCFLLSRLRDCPSPVPSYSFREKEEEVDREYRD